jgi:hypothetical protein
VTTDLELDTKGQRIALEERSLELEPVLPLAVHEAQPSAVAVVPVAAPHISRHGYRQSLRASKDEALLAVDLYNRAGHRRTLEAFVVHMHIAWLYLLHSQFLKGGRDIRYWDGSSKRRRLIRVGGEPKTWDLQRCVEERWAEHDPVRQNIQFFIGLRNKIEHRHEAAIAVAISGLAQAHVLNYEEELVNQFGKRESLADELRFPLFLSSLTESGIMALKRLTARIPRRTARYVDLFYGKLDKSVAEDPRFEFRVHLVPKIGPKTKADLAISFVRLEDLSEDAREELTRAGQTATVIVRKAERPVQNLGWLRPRDVVQEVKKQWAPFNMGTFVRSWQLWKVRPNSTAPDPAATDEKYCVYDSAHGDYLYSKAYVQRILRDREKLVGGALAVRPSRS